jgi:hypothetical protein
MYEFLEGHFAENQIPFLIEIIFCAKKNSRMNSSKQTVKSIVSCNFQVE